MPLVTSICHLFEDNLSSRRESHKFEKAFVDHSLALIDLLQRVANDREEDTERITRELDALRQSLHCNQCTLMVLESSKVMAMLIENAFQQMPVKLIVMTDGMQALNRLLSEPVDIIIASNNLSSLSGIAVISAIKNNAALNAYVPVLFYSSSPNYSVDKVPGLICFRKNPELAQQLASEVAKLTEKKI